MLGKSEKFDSLMTTAVIAAMTPATTEPSTALFFGFLGGGGGCGGCH